MAFIEREDNAVRPTRVRDSGMSLVELLCAIVLLGTVGGAVLGSLAMSTKGSALHRDHSNAHAWLQSAADRIYAGPRQDCDLTQATIKAFYLSMARGELDENGSPAVMPANEVNPEGWPTTNITLSTDVSFWDGKNAYGTICYDNLGIYLELIKLQVKNPEGRIVESIEVVKGA